MTTKIKGYFRLFTGLLIIAGALAAQADETEKPPGSKLSVGYDYDQFDRDLDPWHMFYISLSQKTEAGSLVARVNRAQRFGDTGYQGELDFYPSLGEGKYLYLNVGYANSDIFPEWRSGAEYFHSLPSSMEASLGFRLLQFTGEPVKMYTGSLSKYWGSYLFTLRPYYIPDSVGDSWSGSLMARNYLNDEEYVSLTVGSGVATAADVNFQIFQQRSQKISLAATLKVSDTVFVSPGIALHWFEFFPGIYRRQESVSLSLQFPL